MKRLLLLLFITINIISGISAQTETLSNVEIIEMSLAGLSKDIILQKVKTTGSNYDISVKGLIELKKSNIDDEVLTMIVEKSKTQSVTNESANVVSKEKKSLTSIDVLHSARTISFSKRSLNPSLQNLEKELLKLPAWQKINLSITEDKTNADLAVEIGFVHLSLITHRYVYRVYDKRSGLLIAAGETTSWGSLPHNMAASLTKSLTKVLEVGK